jgi:NAD-dependent DNA ligase
MSALSGLCFAITGTLSVGRADFEELITSNGGEVAKSVTKKCTHLIR